MVIKSIQKYEIGGSFYEEFFCVDFFSYVGLQFNSTGICCSTFRFDDNEEGIPDDWIINSFHTGCTITIDKTTSGHSLLFYGDLNTERPPMGRAAQIHPVQAGEKYEIKATLKKEHIRGQEATIYVVGFLFTEQ